MATHHPMDRLHAHLDKAAGHAAQVHADVHAAVAESEASRADSSPDTVRETRAAEGG